MPTATHVLYNHTPRRLNQDVDLVNDTIVILLTTSTHVPALTDAVEADIDNEVSGNGYSRQTLASKTYTTVTTNDAQFAAANAVFTASGGSIVARYWHMLDTTANILMAYGLLDNTVADVTITDGNDLTIDLATSGILNVLNNA